MGYYEHKTKEELLEIVEKLEKKVEGLSSELDSLKKDGFASGTVPGFWMLCPICLLFLTIMPI